MTLLSNQKDSAVLRRKRTCIVIGGGLAGLAAADRAKSRGWDVQVLEAQPQLGGRVKSFRFLKPGGYCDLVCELGGEWIGKDHKTMLRLVKRFHLKKINHQFALSFWNAEDQVQTIYPPGQSVFPRDMQKILDDFQKEFRRLKTAGQKKLDKLDWWSKLKLLGFTNEALLRRDLMDGTDFGESIRQTSAFGAAAEYFSKNSNDTDEMDYKIAGGNSRLIEALAESIGRTSVHTDAPVHQVIQRGNRVEVRFGSGRSFEGDACICAIPASCLRHITWKPRLHADKVNAANQLQYARITKTAVLFKDRFWDDPNARPGGFSVFSDRVSDFCFDSTYLQPGPGGILCSYAVGEKADDIAAEPDVIQVGEWISHDVRNAMPKRRSGPNPKVLNVQRQAWQKQDWITGAYAFYRPGQWFTIQPALLKRHENVFFAGEHVADDQGFMEGAVATGIAAANNLGK